MIQKLKKIDRTLLELLTGIFLCSVVCQMVALLLPFDRLKSAVGIWLGALIAVFSAFHMWRSLNKAFLCDAKSAARLMAGGYLLRYLIVAVFLVFLFFTNAGHILAGFAGVMTLKMSAFLQPVTHKFYNRVFHESDPVAMPLSELEEAEYGKEE